MENNTIENTYN